MKPIKLLCIAALLLLDKSGKAQVFSSECEFDENLLRIESIYGSSEVRSVANSFNRDMRAFREEMDLRLAELNLNNSEAIITIPVVVHYVGDREPPPGIVYLNYDNDAYIEETQHALNRTNEYLRKTGIFGNPSGSEGVDSRFELCLAQQDPDGNASSGITIQEGNFVVSSLSGSQSEYKITQWDRTRYLNIWVVRTTGDNPGLGTIPWLSWFEPQYDGITIDALFFRELFTGSSLNLNILAHEFGHYMGLLHTFEPFFSLDGCTDTDCWEDGDRICDTPVCEETNTCDPDNTCHTDSPDLNDAIHNYMSRNGNSCRYEFTKDQVATMHFYLEAYRWELGNSTGCGQGVNTCLDGLQNNGETGMDCGGICPPCIQAATPGCNDANPFWGVTAHPNEFQPVTGMFAACENKPFLGIYGCLRGDDENINHVTANTIHAGGENFWYGGGIVNLTAKSYDNCWYGAHDDGGGVRLYDGFKAVPGEWSNGDDMKIRVGSPICLTSICPCCNTKTCPDVEFSGRYADPEAEEESIEEGTTNNHSNFDLRVFPNPNDGTFSIMGCKTVKEVYLLDFSGRTIARYQNTIGSDRMEFREDSFASGIYLVKAVSQNSQIIMQRMVIKR